MKRIKNFFILLAELNKVRVTFAVTLTTLAGFTLASGTINKHTILLLLGVFILAGGSATLNHFQDRDKDLLMDRTKNRPIPSGRISGKNAIGIAFAEIILGTCLIYYGSNLAATQLGLITLIWYNVFYTMLKRITAFAVIPGSVTGAIPPVIGWVAAGGLLSDSRLMILAFFFFMSQVPHFWLLMLKYGKEYEKAGYPSITGMLKHKAIERGIFIWTLATAASALMLIAAGLFTSTFFKLVVSGASLWLILVFSNLIRKNSTSSNPSPYFIRINVFMLIMILSMILDPLLFK